MSRVYLCNGELKVQLVDWCGRVIGESKEHINGLSIGTSICIKFDAEGCVANLSFVSSRLGVLMRQGRGEAPLVIVIGYSWFGRRSWLRPAKCAEGSKWVVGRWWWREGGLLWCLVLRYRSVGLRG